MPCLADNNTFVHSQWSHKVIITFKSSAAPHHPPAPSKHGKELFATASISCHSWPVRDLI